MGFRDDFLWGAAGAAAQIEGAWDADGKCPSIWDVAGDRVRGGQTCHEACDHYRRFREDVALMRELGLTSYRFSVSWCRVIPARGTVNPAGLDFYRALALSLREAGIEPIVTLYHWDLPRWVQENGGWRSPQTVTDFTDYAVAVVDALSPVVRYWITFNEPQVFLTSGYLTGEFAPFKREYRTFRKCHVRHFLLAHGDTVRLIRERAVLPPQIGIAMAATNQIPRREDADSCRRAAHRSFETVAGQIANGLYGDPIFLGRVPGLLRGTLSPEDLERIAQPLDFVGVNVYRPLNAYTDPAYRLDRSIPRTMMGWPVDPRCLYWTVRQYYERYHLPVMVTENGIACPDTVAADGAVHDPDRCAFLTAFVAQLRRAADEGIPVIGYQHWAVMDNFEWLEGYAPRFGLIYVDYATQKRIIKDSGRQYAALIRQNGERGVPDGK